MLVKITRKNIGGGKPVRGSYMYTPGYARQRVYISGTLKTWMKMPFDRMPLMVSGILSHEQLHLTLEKISHKASEKLDKKFGYSDNWDIDLHGMGNFDKEYKPGNILGSGHNNWPTQNKK